MKCRKDCATLLQRSRLVYRILSFCDLSIRAATSSDACDYVVVQTEFVGHAYCNLSQHCDEDFLSFEVVRPSVRNTCKYSSLDIAKGGGVMSSGNNTYQAPNATIPSRRSISAYC